MIKNNRFDNMFKLSSKISIYIPTTKNVNENMKREEIEILVDDTLKLFSNCFGGATNLLSIGTYTDNNNNLVKEKINIVYSYCNTDTLEKNIDTILDYTKKLVSELKQECIALEINNEMYFID